jgi:hypothetical protein
MSCLDGALTDVRRAFRAKRPTQMYESLGLNFQRPCDAGGDLLVITAAPAVSSPKGTKDKSY